MGGTLLCTVRAAACVPSLARPTPAPAPAPAPTPAASDGAALPFAREAVSAERVPKVLLRKPSWQPLVAQNACLSSEVASFLDSCGREWA